MQDESLVPGWLLKETITAAVIPSVARDLGVREARECSFLQPPPAQVPRYARDDSVFQPPPSIFILLPSSLQSSLPLLLDHHLRPVLQPAADGGVAAGHDLLARLDALLDLDVGGVGDAGLHLLHAHGGAVLDEDHALELLALLAGALLL